MGKRLVVPHIQIRYENSVGLQKRVVEKMRNILNAENPPPTTDPANQNSSDRNRRYICIEEIRGKEDYRKLKNFLAKVKMQCEKYKRKFVKYICSMYAKFICSFYFICVFISWFELIIIVIIIIIINRFYLTHPLHMVLHTILIRAHATLK